MQDLRRLWLKTSEHEASQDQAAVGQGFLNQQVDSEKSDPIAVYARMIMIMYLTQTDLLDQLKTPGGLKDSVFKVAAKLPLPNGVQSFNPDKFMTALKQLPAE